MRCNGNVSVAVGTDFSVIMSVIRAKFFGMKAVGGAPPCVIVLELDGVGAKADREARGW